MEKKAERPYLKFGYWNLFEPALGRDLIGVSHGPFRA
jgi:hypothetical protein